jgi:hypothetical protein
MQSHLSVDDDRFNAGSESDWICVGRAICHARRINNQDVGKLAGPKPATVFEPKTIGGRRGHLSNGIWKL